MSEYNHDRAKVLCPEAAAEVERLRDVLKEALETIDAQSDDLNYMQVLIDGLYDDLEHCDAP